jgi:stage II sporulation protein D
MEREQEWQVRGAGAFPPVRIDGADISPVLAYLTALDILPHESSLAYFKDTAGFQETAEWMRRACVLIGKRSEKFAPEQRALNFIGFARLVVDGFQWQERTQNLVGRSEAGYVTKDLSSLGGEEKSALAFFIISGIFPDSQELADRSRLLTRAEAAHYLAKVMATYRDFYHQGYFRELIKDRLVVVENDEIKQFELAPDVFLFRNMGEAVSLVPSLDLLGGDAIRWVENGSRVTLLQAVSWPITNILDRPSQYHRWQVRISREDLESRINQYYPIGKLIDLIPGKRGVSKRVIELAIIGQESQVRVTGTKIRQVLNLRDNLFVIDREQDEDNGATHFIFSGKGWGHGVGLCQVGAHRMAQKGAKCDEILKKYYRGIKVDKIY